MMPVKPLMPVKLSDLHFDNGVKGQIFEWLDDATHRVEANRVANAGALACVNEDGSLTLTIKVPEVRTTHTLAPGEWALGAVQ